MPRISGGSARRASVIPALVVLASLTLAGCGDEADGAGDASAPASDPPSSTPADSPTGSPASGDPGASADGACGGGEVETTVVDAADGVRMTVPADWRVEVAAQGSQVGLYPPDRGAGDGFLVVEDTGQSLDEAVQDALEFTVDSAETTSEQDLELDGFDGARLLTFEYDDSDSTFSVDLVAVTDDGLRVVANMTSETAEARPLAESCLSSLERAE